MILEWPSSLVPPAPLFCEDGLSYTTVHLHSPVIHAGARLLVFAEGQDCPRCICRETAMTVRDVQELSQERPDLRTLREQVGDLEEVVATISVISHTRHEIRLQLGHRRYRRETAEVLGGFDDLLPA